MKTAVVVTLHNYLRLFGHPCINLLVRHLPEPREILVFDNSSRPSLAEMYPEDLSLPDVRYRYIEDQHENGGLTGTWNQGIDWAEELGCDRVILLNHDTRPDRTIRELVSVCGSREDAVFGPVSDNPGVGGGRWQRLNENKSIPQTGTAQIPSINGFCMAATVRCWRSFSFDREHVFDPSIPFGGNEDEFIRRARSRGCRFYVCRDAVMRHFKNNAFVDAGPVFDEGGKLLRRMRNRKGVVVDPTF